MGEALAYRVLNDADSPAAFGCLLQLLFRPGGHSGKVTGVAFSPDGPASLTREARAAVLFDLGARSSSLNPLGGHRHLSCGTIVRVP